MSSEQSRQVRLAEGPPAPRGRHPADVAGQWWERDRVRGLRGRGVSWAHIAQQLGKCERQLRATYEPKLTAAETPPPVSASRRDPVFIACLIAIEAEPGASIPDLAYRLDKTPLEAAGAAAILRRRGWARNLCEVTGRPSCWVTTAAGRAELARREEFEPERVA